MRATRGARKHEIKQMSETNCLRPCLAAWSLLPLLKCSDTNYSRSLMQNEIINSVICMQKSNAALPHVDTFCRLLSLPGRKAQNQNSMQSVFHQQTRSWDQNWFWLMSLPAELHFSAVKNIIKQFENTSPMHFRNPKKDSVDSFKWAECHASFIQPL